MQERTGDPHALLMQQFLGWIGEDGRGYAETMEAWRSSCPRLSIWEDALEAGFVTIEGSDARSMADMHVSLGALGSAMLAAHRTTPRS